MSIEKIAREAAAELSARSAAWGNEILNVYIKSANYEHEVAPAAIVVADVDARSSADALDYFMRSRNIDASGRVLRFEAEGMVDRTACVVAEVRHLITGALIAEYWTEVH